MRFTVYLFTIILLLASCSDSPRHEVSDNGHKKSSSEWKFIMTEKKQYFLHLTPRDSINATFHYCNNTGKLQLIDTVKVSCACTNVKFNHAPIKPNEQGDIKLTIDIKGDVGYFSKAAAVYFHNQKPVVLKVMGKIEEKTKDK